MSKGLHLRVGTSLADRGSRALNHMLKVFYITTVALPVICCWTAHADPTNAPLKFYILSEEKIEGGRFIDTPAIPQAGYIGDKPDLTVTEA